VSEAIACAVTLYEYCPYCGALCLAAEMDNTGTWVTHEHHCAMEPMEVEGEE